MNTRPDSASLRIRILFAFLIMLAVLVVALQILTGSIIGRGYYVVEERMVHDRVTQALNALNTSLAGLSRSNRDYATWDDTYAFVVNRDLAYLEAYMTDETFRNLDVSYVAFVDGAGKLVYARAIDLATGQEAPPPPALLRFDGPQARLLQHSDPAGALAGLVILDNQPMLLTARPILTSLGEGPPAGTLLMGRMLDANELAQIAEITRLPVAVARLDDPALAPELRQAAAAITGGTPVVTLPLDDQQIVGATHIADLLGGPGLLLYLDLPREVYQLGLQARGEYTLVLLTSCLLFGGMVLWMIEYTVLRRTILLSSQVAAIDVTRPEASLSVGGSDEIGRLGEALNQMLRRLAQAQEQLIASELRYRQLIEITPDAIIIHDYEHIRYINPAGARLLGYQTPASAIGQPVDAVIGAIRPQADGTPRLTDRVLNLPDGAQIEAELVVLPFRDHELPAIQVIVRNITERKQVEYALRAAKEAADAANRAKSQFLSTMSHELRTPLTAIIGYAELLEHELTPTAEASVLRDLARIRTSGAHLLALINDVLDLSKIEAGRMSTRHAPVQLTPLLQTIVDTVRPIAERNGNHLEVRLADTARTVLTDEVHLRQILINLLGNACKFTHNGSVTLSVTRQDSGGAAEGAQILFAVQDTGIGISPEQQRQLFRDFVQVDSSSTRKYGGTGLGLALSQRLARLLGGEITVSSELGVGSTFTLRLPCEPTEVAGRAPGTDDHGPQPVVAGPAAPLDDANASETRIVLVIDDDPAVRDLLPRALSHQGLHFETAASGIEGLELAQALLPDLIILDVLLPELNGWAVLEQLKANPVTATIPVLMLTISEEADRGIVLGAAGYVRKPAGTETIAHEVAALLSMSPEPPLALIVEDDADVRDYLRRTLEQGGWIVAEAGDGPTALALLDLQRPVLAVVDLMLPGMDGITLIDQIRARPGGDTLPIVVVTAKDLTADEQAQLNRSVEQVLRKGSFRGDELVRSTWALVEWHSRRSAAQEGKHGAHSHR